MGLPDFPERDQIATAPEPPRRPVPLKFEPSLVPRLVAAHKTLNARFADLVPLIERDPKASIAGVEECASQFSALRHIETIWMYPLIAHAVEGDVAARGQFLELRLIALMMARRVQRCFDELLQAARAEVLVADAARRLAGAIAKYSVHAEQAAYPLYELIGTQRDASAVA